MSQGNFGAISDKAWLGYMPAYHRIAADLGPAARVCEVGVYHGESLQLWMAMFPYGEVTGIDRDPGATWPPGARQVVHDVRDPGLAALAGGPFDLVVDDGGHFGDQAHAAFGALWPLLAPGGYYVVEDWYVSLPGYPSYPHHGGTGMLDFVQSLLPMLDSPESAADEIAFRYGLCIVHRRKS